MQIRQFAGLLSAGISAGPKPVTEKIRLNPLVLMLRLICQRTLRGESRVDWLGAKPMMSSAGVVHRAESATKRCRQCQVR